MAASYLQEVALDGVTVSDSGPRFSTRRTVPSLMQTAHQEGPASAASMECVAPGCRQAGEGEDEVLATTTVSVRIWSPLSIVNRTVPGSISRHMRTAASYSH